MLQKGNFWYPKYLYITEADLNEDKNMKKINKISALVLTALFATMQISMAEPIDTGLGNGLGGAVINSADGGFAGVETGTNSATLNFTGDSHVNWNTLNLNSDETLNFNATNGATGVTVLNTVSSGMSSIYGQITSNAGIGKVIISNPNGILFDGARFTATGGDISLTTQPLSAAFTNGQIDISKVGTDNAVGVVTIKDSDFSTSGEFNILAPSVSVSNSHVAAGKGFYMVTANGQDYLSTGNTAPEDAVKLEAVNVDGNVYIVSGKGYVKTTNGGTINGNLNIKSDDSVVLNYNDGGKVLNVKGDVNAKANGWAMYARNTIVDGNLNMENGGGFLEVGNVRVGKDMNLKTTPESENAYGYKHFVHVVGNNEVKGNATIESKDNIHIGNYDFDEQALLKGNFKVGGTLTAHAKDGHVAVTINTQADKINLKSDNLNIIASDKATLTANEYQFSSNGYIGAISDYTKEDGTVLTADEQFVALMENYKYIPRDIKSHNYMNIAGGEVSKINTRNDAQVYIASKGDMQLTGANAGDINLTAYGSRIDITGDVHAKNINVGNETDVLKVDFPGRDYTLNYTNIRDGKVVTVKPDEVITYELTDAPTGHNAGHSIDEERTDTTYLIGPGYDPVPPPPTPEPVVPSNPSVDPEAERNLMTQWVPEDATAAPINTPVAYAADLDDDDLDKAVRKNVDGSVTVVRAFPMVD